MPAFSHRLLAGYYLAGTLAFAVLDVWLGVGVRVPGLEGSAARWPYYAGLLILGGVAFRFPRTAPWIGMGESLTNLILVLLAILLPIWSLAGVLDAGADPAGAVMSFRGLLGALLSGGVFLFGFYEGLYGATAAVRRTRRHPQGMDLRR
jgi:hypothetical protein